MKKFVVICLLASIAFAKDAPKSKPFDPVEDINKPRPDARHVTFTTEEATWSSVDLSPDGQTLLFDILGDLYTVPVAGGKAKALTKGPAWDYHPRYSPDGRTIAFTTDRSGIENVWLMNADGTNARALTEEKAFYVRSAAWSPDGDYIVARREDAKRGGIPPQELWMWSVYGGSGVKLTSSDELNNAAGPVFSPDGRFIYFAAREAHFSYTPDLSGGLWAIDRYDRRTGDTTKLTTGIGGAARPAISPDGRWLFFVSRRDADTDLIVRDLSNGAERVLVPKVTRDDQEGFTAMDVWPNYAISRDGKTIFFSNHGKLNRVDIASGNVTNIPFTADVEQWLAQRVTFQDRVESGPSLHARILRWTSQSPDGKAVVFDAFGRIWSQAIENGKASGAPRRLTPDDASLPKREYAPSVSPDGRWVVYVSWSDKNGGDVWRVPLAGGTPEKLTKIAGHYANPEWSPAGDKLVVIRGSGLEFRERQPEEEEFFDITWMPSSGGDLQYVTAVGVADTFRFHPQAWFSADGTRLYYRDFIKPQKRSDDPKNDLVSIRLDGTDKKKLLRFPAIGDLIPSPDEKWVAFTSRDNVYVTPLPNLVLKEPPSVSLQEGSVPVWRLSEDAGGYVDWADGGKTITWNLGNQFHRLPLASAMAFVEAERKKAEKKDKDDDKKSSDKKEDEPKLKVPKSESITIDMTTPRPAPSGTTVILNARVISMKGDEVLEHGDVIVTGNRITAVGENLKAPEGAKVIDGSGKTIIPGIIDTHAHMHYSSFELYPETKWEYAANLAYGVTTIYDPSAPSLDVFSQAEMVDGGFMIGPRVYSSGDVLYGGAQEDIFADVDNLDDAKRQVRRMKAYGARMIKVYQQPGRSQRIWFAEASRGEHMLLTAEGAGELATDLSMTLDGYTAWEHSLPVEIGSDVVQLVAKSGTYYTPTLIVSYGGPWGEEYLWQSMLNLHDDPKLRRFTPHLIIDAKSRRHAWIDPSEYQFPTVAHGAALVVRAGGNVSMGAHGQVQGLGPHWEIWAHAGENAPAGFAMTPHEALRAATLSAADKLGFATDLGSIEPGKLADFVILDANPLDDIHNSVKVHWVVKNGVVYEGETLKVE